MSAGTEHRPKTCCVWVAAELEEGMWLHEALRALRGDVGLMTEERKKRLLEFRNHRRS